MACAYQLSVLPSWYPSESERMQAKHNPGQHSKAQKRLVGEIEFANKIQQQTLGGFCGRTFADFDVQEKQYQDVTRYAGSIEARVMNDFEVREGERRRNRNRPTNVQMGCAAPLTSKRGRPSLMDPPSMQRSMKMEASRRKMITSQQVERVSAYEKNRTRAMATTLRLGKSHKSPYTPHTRLVYSCWLCIVLSCLVGVV